MLIFQFRKIDFGITFILCGFNTFSQKSHKKKLNMSNKKYILLLYNYY